jgi:hypothetical protein
MKTMIVNPVIAAAIEERRNAFVAHSLARTQAVIDRVFSSLQAVGWELDKYAPRPRGDMCRRDYAAAKVKRSFVDRLTRRQAGSTLVAVDSGRVASFLDNAKILASASFDSYIAKLSRKVGDCVNAKIDEKDLWHGAILTITRADGSVEKWKTQTIINVSCRGTQFNQWPTRRVRSK